MEDRTANAIEARVQTANQSEALHNRKGNRRLGACVSRAFRGGPELDMYRASIRAFCEAKGRLYNLIKDIISAGQALDCHDPEAASQYNSKVLCRFPTEGSCSGMMCRSS